MSIKNIEIVIESKTQTKFRIIVEKKSDVKNDMEQYIWKCSNKEERDYWVNGLKKHISQLKDVYKVVS